MRFFAFCQSGNVESIVDELEKLGSIIAHIHDHTDRVEVFSRWNFPDPKEEGEEKSEIIPIAFAAAVTKYLA